MQNVFPPVAHRNDEQDDLNNSWQEPEQKTLELHKDKDTFIRQCVEAHNKYREQHGSPPLILKKELCDYASSWAHVSQYFN